MPKEKFDRSKPHVNIGTIGHINEHKDSLVNSIIQALFKNKSNKNIKQKLKNKSPYGKKYF